MNAVLLKQFTRDYPDVVLDITTDESPLDPVAGRFDAGIHLGEFIEQDMIATRVSRDQRSDRGRLASDADRSELSIAHSSGRRRFTSSNQF